MKKLKACILGSTGNVGQHFVKLLSNHPFFEIEGLAASEKSAGTIYENVVDWTVSTHIPENVRDITVCSTDSKSLEKLGVDLFFSALPGDISREKESEIARMGYPVFTNASGNRMTPHVPILIPEINSDHIELINHQKYNGGYIVANSNCSTSGLVFGLKPLQSFGIREVFVTTYQAVSGAGRKGVASMDILGNIIPFIKNEEAKLESETQIILGHLKDREVERAKFPINASCARVPVMDGHLESVAVKLEDDISCDVVIDEFAGFSGPPQELSLPTAPAAPIIIQQEDNRPQPQRDLSDNGMSVSIGRVRKKGDWLNFFLLVHNTIRGAAGASILNAEYSYVKGLLGQKTEVAT
ncbi:MAG: aspartate-semialdehyde dehydrogenase [Candidatus Thorarchaeota archaeon]|nr:aspartate-semialdehyde dehydrogenase [Candidatus Thorarchaeota archaeon]